MTNSSHGRRRYSLAPGCGATPGASGIGSWAAGLVGRPVRSCLGMRKSSPVLPRVGVVFCLGMNQDIKRNQASLTGYWRDLECMWTFGDVFWMVTAQSWPTHQLPAVLCWLDACLTQQRSRSEPEHEDVLCCSFQKLSQSWNIQLKLTRITPRSSDLTTSSVSLFGVNWVVPASEMYTPWNSMK